MPKTKNPDAVLSLVVDGPSVTASTIGTKPAPSSKLSKYQLDWNDGSPVLSGQGAPPATVTHAYAPVTVETTYRVKLQVWDKNGLTDTDTKHAVIAPTVPPPPPPPPPTTDRQLIGGWRLAGEFARGAIAIDFTTNRLWMIGHAQRNEVLEYQLPPMGTGGDLGQWPRVDPVRVIPGWWSGGYGNGLVLWRGKLWVAPRNGYDTSPPSTLTLFARDAETIVLPLPRQAFSGFVKRGPGLDPFIGCGGYESGQGSISGPSLATLDGEIKISYRWPSLPGANLENWPLRAPRDPNYYPKDHVDGWVAWEPRTIDGVLEGRWACDRIWGGGVVLPEGITYWPWMGTGDLDYARQNYTFGADGLNRTYVYRYDPATYQLLGWAMRADLGMVCGHELDAQGRVYLSLANQWASGLYRADVAVKVFG